MKRSILWMVLMAGMALNAQVEVVKGMILDTLTTAELAALPASVKIKGAVFYNGQTDNVVKWDTTSGSFISIEGGGGSADGNINNISFSNPNLIVNGSGGAFDGQVDLSSLDTNTQLNEAQVDAFVANNGYLTTQSDDQTSSEVALDDAGNDFTATDVDAALKELEDNQIKAIGFSGGSRDIVFQTDQGPLQTLPSSSYDQDASEVEFTPYSTITSTDAQSALQELKDEVDALSANGTGIVAEGVATSDGSGSIVVTHNLGYSPANTRITLNRLDDGVSSLEASPNIGVITSTTFTIVIDGTQTGDQFAWKIFGTDTATPLNGNEIVSSINTELGNTDWQSGGSGTDDQTALEVPFTPAGSIAATDTQNAIEELDTDLQLRATEAFVTSGLSGQDEGSEISSSVTPSNYSLGASSGIDQHLLGIDTALGSIGSGSGLTTTQEDQLEGMYGSWYELMSADEDGTQDPFLDLNGERRQRIGYVQASQTREVSLDNNHALGRKYMYYVSSTSSSINFKASSGVAVIFEGAGDSQTGDQILVDAMGTHVYFTRIASNQYVISAAGTISTQDATPPTVTSATIPSAGTTISVVFNEDITVSDVSDLSFDGALSDVTLSNPSAVGSTASFDLSRTVNSGESGNFVYGASNTIDDLNGNSLAAGSTAVTNNSTQGGVTNFYAADDAAHPANESDSVNASYWFKQNANTTHSSVATNPYVGTHSVRIQRTAATVIEDDIRIGGLTENTTYNVSMRVAYDDLGSGDALEIRLRTGNGMTANNTITVTANGVATSGDYGLYQFSFTTAAGFTQVDIGLKFADGTTANVEALFDDITITE